MTAKPTVLCLTSQQFIRDVQELQRRGTRYQYLPVLDLYLAEVQNEWIPERLQEQGIYVNEVTPETDAMWDKSREFGIELIKYYQDEGHNVVAVMAGNWDYWNDECMRLACEAMGLPFLVLMREHDLSEIRVHNAEVSWLTMRRIPFTTALASAGPATTDLIADLNLLPRSKMRDTGWPRHDMWRYSQADKPLYDRPVVLMSYLKGYDANDHFADVMLPMFGALQHKFPHIPFVVKAKHEGDRAAIQQIAKDKSLDLKVIDTDHLPRLINNARAVIGFRSMIMYECLLAPAPIILPQWGETDQDPNRLAPNPLDPRLRGHMHFAKSTGELEAAVEAACSAGTGDVDMETRAKVFQEYFVFSPDRTNTERVEDFIDEFTGAVRSPG